MIALALAHENAVVLIDEKKGRRIAREHGLPVIGTLGVVLRAKQQGLISAVKPLMDLLAATGFRMSDALYQDVLRRAHPTEKREARSKKPDRFPKPVRFLGVTGAVVAPRRWGQAVRPALRLLRGLGQEKQVLFCCNRRISDCNASTFGPLVVSASAKISRRDDGRPETFASALISPPVLQQLTLPCPRRVRNGSECA